MSPDNVLIIAGCEDGSIKIFNVQTKEQVYHFKNIHKGRNCHENS